jgi:GT2 family glycosyltransferase
VRETVPYIQSLDGDNWELLILPNEADLDEWCDDRINFIPSGRVGPAEKRDLGAQYANGEILVFLDDDSYPNSDLLSVATPYFSDEGIVAVGGPAITPPTDSFWQKVSGAVFLSKFSGGNPERYLPIGAVKEIDDWPSVNLMVRKNDFISIGGFNSLYWPGEDTKLCLDLIEKTKKIILYIPKMKVWHHRREGIGAHLKQVGAYGLHRGHFARIYPKNSRKIIYFVPTLFTLFLISTLLIKWLPTQVQDVYMVGWSIYILALIKAFIDITSYENIKVAIASMLYVVATHAWYGFRFMQGFCTKNLISRLR